MKTLILLLLAATNAYPLSLTFITRDTSPAAIAPGPYSTGWFDTLPFSTNQGFWDLGSSGTITVPVKAGQLTVETVEWYDGMIYGQWTTGTVNGIPPSSESFDLSEPWIHVGNWYSHKAVFTVQTNGNLVITSSPNGSVIDRLTITSESVKRITIQSSDSMAGPWADAASVVVITNKSDSTFYRLKIE